ncbi:hypothetical protein [Paenibacillus sp. ISL-20]|nr:hypothetical protein [Paenibacillus sp. ISL-20]MBT2759894.1 hypothetical protein [Paenibacillus sp. ISL-20]
MKLIDLKELVETLIEKGHAEKEAIYTNEGVNFTIEGYSIEDGNIRFF